jgi:hypothetical protein
MTTSLGSSFRLDAAATDAGKAGIGGECSAAVNGEREQRRPKGTVVAGM